MRIPIPLRFPWHKRWSVRPFYMHNGNPYTQKDALYIEKAPFYVAYILLCSLWIVRSYFSWPWPSLSWPTSGWPSATCHQGPSSNNSSPSGRLQPGILITRPGEWTWWCHGPLARYVILRVAHAPGMPGTFSPPPWVNDPDMHHGTCVTHVPWCMPGSLTSGFLWSRGRGKRSRHSRRMRNPQFYVSGERPMTWDMMTSWKRFPHYWPFVWGVYWSLENFPKKGPVIQGALEQTVKLPVKWDALTLIWHHCNEEHLINCCHTDTTFITGTGSCQNDNFWCSQWWKFHQNGGISDFSVIIKQVL